MQELIGWCGVASHIDTLGWSSKVKYLGLYLTSGANFKIDLNTAKHKYFGCFNNIKSVIGQHVNEMMVLKLVKTLLSTASFVWM